MSSDWSKIGYGLNLIAGLGLAVLLPMFLIMWFGYVIETWLNLAQSSRVGFLILGLVAGLFNAYRMLAARFR